MVCSKRRMPRRSRPLGSAMLRVIAAFVPLAACVEAHEPMGSNPPVTETPDSPGGNPPAQGGPTCSDRGEPGCARPPAMFDAGSQRDASPELPDRAPDADRSESNRERCPALAPGQGQPCSVPAHHVCGYGNCDGVPTTQAACREGHWSVVTVSCDRPTPCPDVEPSVGDVCESGWGEPQCAYAACDGGAAITYGCANDRWKVARPCPGSSCPATEPPLGASCPYPGERCEYHTCEDGVSKLTLECLNFWSARGARCNPLACPEVVPAEGSSCPPVGQGCLYQQELFRGIQAECVNGAWKHRFVTTGGTG